MYTDYERVYTKYLMHHGTKGMKWGVRRALKKYNTMQTASLTSKKANPQKLNKIMEKDWANNKVQITKEMKTQRRLGKATVASALVAYGGLAVYAIGMISKNNKLRKAGLAVSLGGTAATVAGVATAAGVAALDGRTKLSRRKYEYTNRKGIY